MAPKTKPAAEQPAVGRRFRIRATDPDTKVARVCVGASPRVCIDADTEYVTDDEKLASRLACDPHLEEVTAP